MSNVLSESVIYNRKLFFLQTLPVQTVKRTKRVTFASDNSQPNINNPLADPVPMPSDGQSSTTNSGNFKPKAVNPGRTLRGRALSGRALLIKQARLNKLSKSTERDRQVQESPYIRDVDMDDLAM